MLLAHFQPARILAQLAMTSGAAPERRSGP